MRSRANRLWRRETPSDSEEGQHPEGNPPLDQLIDDKVLSPLQVLERRVTQQELEDLIEKVHVAVADNELLRQMVECAEAGYTTPRECAELIGVDVREIYNARKVLDRRLKAIRTQYTGRPATSRQRTDHGH